AGCSNQRIEQALTGSMNKIATLFHPKIYGGTMLLTLNSSIPEKASFSLHFNNLQLLSGFYIICVLQQSTLLSFISHYLLLFG
ncbi:hypothetical protein, partial [Thiolapillus sp.]|uniref:hypothetical protein n=1 Tax=Thiolapillus sp. TaxID=2017437 RepID=UPI003AF767A7